MTMTYFLFSLTQGRGDPALSYWPGPDILYKSGEHDFSSFFFSQRQDNITDKSSNSDVTIVYVLVVH